MHGSHAVVFFVVPMWLQRVDKTRRLAEQFAVSCMDMFIDCCVGGELGCVVGGWIVGQSTHESNCTPECVLPNVARPLRENKSPSLVVLTN